MMRRLRSLRACGVLILLIASCLPSRAFDRMPAYARLLYRFPNVTCNFESSCSWKWSPDSFTNATSSQLKSKLESKFVIKSDADGNELGKNHSNNSKFIINSPIPTIFFSPHLQMSIERAQIFR